MASKNPFKVVSTKPIYVNPWINVREDKVIRPGGTEGIFGVITVGCGTTVVPLSANQTIYLVKEYKYGHGDYMLQCVGGGLDKDETPLEAGKRELLEEIGGISDDWVHLGCTVSLPNVVDFREDIFLARNVDLDEAQQTDDGEDIEIVEIPFLAAIELVKKGEIIHDASVAAILKAHLLLTH